MQEYIDLVLRKEKKPIDFEKLCRKVESLIQKDQLGYILTSEDVSAIQNIVQRGIENFDYIQMPSGRISTILKTSFRKGKFHGNKAGEGFVTTTTSYINREGEQIVKTDKYSILRDDCHGAIDGDFVLIDIGGNGKKPQVERVLNRNLEIITGEVYRIGSRYFVKPVDKKKMALTIALDQEAIEGQRVAVTLKEQTNDDFYIGEIVRVFSHKDDPDEDILWEAFKCGIDDQFSKQSLEQVEKIPQKVLDSDKLGREDLTDWEIFTIDGEDTKDIDDALSCRRLPNGNYEVGVHIMDVSHYIPEGSPLDLDAYKKGTSNYLAGKVIPMLPHELSNGICSLNPYVERLAMSCIMEVSPTGQVLHYRISPTVIKSQLKMSYTIVNQILKEGAIPSEYQSHADTLKLLNKLALLLRKNRIQRGSVEFDKPELKLLFGEEGEVVGFSSRSQDVGENLIEEFMLLANETVDKHLSDCGYPCVHRIHDTPNQERLTEFLKLLNAVNLPYDRYKIEELISNPHALQDLSNHIKQADYIYNMLSTNMVRCMSRAKYSPTNIGHSGLAKDYYCHFTSPIRRYPDLTVHRIIKDCCLDPKNGEQNAKKWERKLPDICEQSSKMERIADDAEIQTLAMKCSEYMERHIGEEFEGTIIGLSDKGIQVQLDNLVEGRVRNRNLMGDYSYNPVTYTLISLDGHPNYYIGDRLLVRVKSASKVDKTIDFEIVEKLKENHTVDINNSNGVVKIKARKDRMNRTLLK